MIDKILTEQIDIPENECAVLLSGGVDSISVGFGAHRLGKKITAYSFCLDTNVSYDYIKAEEVCRIMDWEFVGIRIPTEELETDWHRLVKLGCRKKTHYECVYPFLYVYPKIKEKYVLSGWAADGYYGLSKKAKINFSKTRELQVKFMDDYFRTENQAGYLYHKRVVDEYKKILITPYLTEPVKKYFYGRSWDELNRPKQKQDVRQSFKEFELVGGVKNHSNLQLESGINILFETLLDNKKINHNNRKRIMDVCRDWESVSTSNNSNSNTLAKFMETNM